MTFQHHPVNSSAVNALGAVAEVACGNGFTLVALRMLYKIVGVIPGLCQAYALSVEIVRIVIPKPNIPNPNIPNFISISLTSLSLTPLRTMMHMLGLEQVHI